MASNWTEMQLGEVVQLKRGYDLPAAERTPGAVPLVSSSGVSARISSAKVRGPGVVTGRYGTIGEVFFIDEDFWPLNTTLYVHDFKGNDPRFVSYLLRGLDFRAYSDKAAVPGINRNHLHQALVTIPTDVDEQRAIAKMLARFDDLIDLHRRMSQTLEAMARALFKSWFVDFDPARAKSEGRQANLPKAIADRFPDSFEDSELGEIPKGWTVDPISDLAEIVGGSTPSTETPEFWQPPQHFWVTPKDLSGLSTPVLLKTERQISDAGLAQIGSGLLAPGTVLLSSRAPIGYIAISEIPVAVNQGFIAMKPRSGVPGIFLRLWADHAKDEILSRANGSTFLEISKASFRPIPVVRPSDAVLDAFEKRIGPWHQRIVENERQISNLALARDALLPKLMSGELQVSNSDTHVGGGH